MNSEKRDSATVFPLLAALTAAIFIAVWQYVTVLPNITFQHPYSDVLHYVELVNEQQFFGHTHFSWRFILPGFITVLYTLIPISVSTLWMSVNVLLFSLILIVEFRPEDHKRWSQSTFITLLLSVIMLHPAFWRGTFLPMLEIPLFFAIWLMLRIQLRSSLNPTLITFLIFISLWVKEMFILSWLFGIVIYGRQLFTKETLINWHFPFFISGIFYALILFLFGETSSHNNYLLQPELWISDWISLFSTTPLTITKSLIASLAPVWIAYPIVAKYFSSQKTRFFRCALTISLIWLILALFTVTNAPRLIWPFYAVLLGFKQSDSSSSNRLLKSSS